MPTTNTKIYRKRLNILFNKHIKEILFSMQTALKNGQDVYESLYKHKYYVGYISIIFFKIGERNSNFSQSISSLYTVLMYQVLNLKCHQYR